MIGGQASPLQPFALAFRAKLQADALLMAVVSGVYGHLSEAARVAYPYSVIGRRHRDNSGGAMQAPGGRLTLQVDTWSEHKGPAEVASIQSRISELCERKPIAVPGFDVIGGSLTCDFEDIFDEVDPDSPERRLYHGVMLWGAEIHGVA